MSVQYPLPRSTRRIDWTVLPGQTVFGPAGSFIVFDQVDLVVRARASTAERWRTVTSGVTVTLSALPGFASATFAAPPATGSLVRLEVRRVHPRITDVTRSAALISAFLERELDTQATVLQELRRDVNDAQAQAISVPEGQTAPLLDLTPFLGVGGQLGIDASGNLIFVTSGTPGATIVRTQIIDSTALGRSLMAVVSEAAARSFLQLGNAALANVGAGAADVAAGNDPRITGAAQKAQNLADLTDKPLARINIGLSQKIESPFVLPSEIAAFVPASCKVYCGEIGRVPHTFDVERMFHDTNAGLGADSYGSNTWVDPVNGNDTTGTGVADNPFKTPMKAATKAGTGTILCRSGVITDPCSFLGSANTISGGTIARALKFVAVDGPGTVVLRAPGQQPSAMVWTNPAADGRQWQADPAGGETAEMVLYWPAGFGIGEPRFLRFFDDGGFLGDDGWQQNLTTKQIRIRNVKDNVNTNKAKYEIIYKQTSSTVRMNGMRAYFEGFQFRGIKQLDLQYDAFLRPLLWFNKCDFLFSDGHAIHTNGARVVMQSCGIGWSVYDGGNYYAQNEGDGSGQASEIIEIDCSIWGTGVIETRTNQYENYALVRNRQTSSAHDKTLILRINGDYGKGGRLRRPMGQVIADTNTAGTTVMVGCDLGETRALTDGSLTLDRFTCLETFGKARLFAVRGGGGSSTFGWVPVSADSQASQCVFSGVTGNVTGTVADWNPYV